MNTVLNRYRRLRFMLGAILTILVLLSVITSPALAQSQGSSGTSSDEWKFTLAPYLMTPLDGRQDCSQRP